MVRKKTEPVPSRICGVCDAENLGYSSKCIKCGVKLQKKKRNRSAPTNEKRLRKKKKSSCNGNKDSFSSKTKAISAKLQIMKKTGRQLRAYHCKDCNLWHLTKYRS
tara:strand:- start:59 stop:376 length:318 start_codon:yes stop_codon:yes gene_type:complete